MDDNATNAPTTPVAPVAPAAPIAPVIEQPKKYIRTFAGDMETLQKGGAPELAPLAAPQAAKDRLTAASPISPPAPVPASASAKNQPPAPRPEPPLVAPLETYASDFSDKVKEEHASSVTVLAAEQDNAPRVVRSATETSTRGSRLYVIAGIVLLVLGSAGAYIAYARYQATLAPVLLAPSVSAPLFVDEREEILGTGAMLMQAIEQSLARSLTPNTVRLLYLPPATTTSDVFSKLDLSAPAALLRNISAVGSMAGIVNTDGERSPFFVLSVTTYGNTLASMLSWETIMLRSLNALYPTYPVFAATTTMATSSAAATTTPASRTPSVPVFVPGFRDEVVANHDVRIYRDAARRSILLYGYWNQTTLVIARSPQAFTEILQRLATSRAQL